MAKKKKLKKDQIKLINMIAACAAVLFGIVAIVMMFVPSVKIVDTDTVYTGLQVTFGLKEDSLLGVQQIFAFSFMNLLTYILVIVGLVGIVLSFLNKGGKFIPFIAAACFLVAGVFFFLQVQYCIPGDNLINNIVAGFGSNPKEALGLAAGAIVAGILSILASLASLVKVFIK